MQPSPMALEPLPWLTKLEQPNPQQSCAMNSPCVQLHIISLLVNGGRVEPQLTGRLSPSVCEVPGLAPQHLNRKESYQQWKSISGEGLLGLLLEGFEHIVGELDTLPPVSRLTPTDPCLPSMEFPRVSQRQCHQLPTKCSHTQAYGDFAYSGRKLCVFSVCRFPSLRSFPSHYCEH